MIAKWEDLVIRCRQLVSSGSLDKLFEDQYFIFDLIKLLYNESVDAKTKLELLVLVEEFSQRAGVQSSNIDQVVHSLLDVFNQISKKENTHVVSCQILITVTSLLLEHDQLDTEAVQSLINIASTGLNTVENRKLRSTACQCLCQLEECQPGTLWKEKDLFIKLMKQERTNVHEDYTMVVTLILQYGFREQENCSQNGTVEPSGTVLSVSSDTVVSLDVAEYRQIVSFIMENSSLFTQGGIWHITLNLIKFVQNCHEISATANFSHQCFMKFSILNLVFSLAPQQKFTEFFREIFKPMMLNYMSTTDTCLMHLVMFIQNEFEKEVLSDGEEKQLHMRLITGVNHPSLTPAQRLFYCHWIHCLSQVSPGEQDVCLIIKEDSQLLFFPSVFDPMDCQLAKLNLLNLSFPSLLKEENGQAAALLLGSLGYLHKLVWHTGSHRAAKVLFRALFQMYQRHCSKSFSQDINRFLRGLISGFPFFIPHALDFIESLRKMTPDSPVYLEILRLLQNQVVSTPEDQAAEYCFFYLQVLKRASLQTEIPPQGTIRFLMYLAEHSLSIDNGSWELGIGILSVCQNILVCQGTKHLYVELGDLLFFLMMHYKDTDIRDKARFYYMLITSSTDEKIHMIIQPTTDSQSFHHEAISNLLPSSKSRGHSNVINLDDPALQLKRVKIQAEIFLDCDDDSTVKGIITDMKTYYDVLKKYKTVLKNIYEITMIDDNSDVLAVCIYFEEDPNFHPLKEFRFPRIKHKDNQEFVIDIIPLLPIPTKMISRCEFVKKDQTYRCRLSDICVGIEDLAMPLPLHVTDEQNKPADFKCLWDWFLEDSKLDGSCCLESVQIISKPLQEFVKSVHPHLQPCAIQDKEEDCIKYGIFLPPHHHVLMQATNQADYVVVRLLTDFYHSLLYVNRLFSV